MNDQIARQTVKIVNPQGMHARPANLFARTASEFCADIQVVKDGNLVDGKSILGILSLMAEVGSQLEIEAKGRDAVQAIAALANLIECGFGERDPDGCGNEEKQNT